MITGFPLVVLNRIQCSSPPSSFLLLSIWPPAIAGGRNRQKCLWQTGERVGDGFCAVENKQKGWRTGCFFLGDVVVDSEFVSIYM